MKGCLDGIRVLELGNFISGPYGAMLLADMGAEVIKVENPKGGDPFRGWDFGGDQPNFWAYNRGKKSVTLNLQTAGRQRSFLRFGEKSRRGDGQLSSRRDQEARHRFRVAAARSTKELFAAPSPAPARPGPYVKRPAYDTVGQGMGGMMSVLMDPKNPKPVGPAYADCLSGMFSALGVLGALMARNRTGKGQQVDATMVGSILAFLNAPATETLAHGRVPGPYTRPRQSQTYAFACADGAMLAIHLSSPQKFWEGLVQFGRASRVDRRSALQYSAEPAHQLRRAQQNFRGVFQRTAAVGSGSSGSKPTTCRTRRCTT